MCGVLAVHGACHQAHQESLKITLLFMCTAVCPAFMSMWHLHAWCLWKPEEGIASSGTGITDGLSHCVSARN